jgi:hypothetical protein
VATLLDYITEVQGLLHDSTYQFWSRAKLVGYINQGRKMTVGETACTRQLATVDVVQALTQSEATYPYTTIMTSRRVLDVMNVLLQYSSNQNYPLRYLEFDRAVRTALWQYQTSGTPTHYTIHNKSVIILQWPSVPYLASTFDCVIEPINLVNDADEETEILDAPHQMCVTFYAAYRAKLDDQRRVEAENYLVDYTRMKLRALGSEFYRRLPGQ